MKSLLKKSLKQLGLLTLIKRVLRKHPELAYEEVVGVAPQGISHHTVNNEESFIAYKQKFAEELKQRAAVDNHVATFRTSPYYVNTQNFLTGKSNNTYFVSGSGNLREDFSCTETGLNNRVRATLYAIRQSGGFDTLAQKKVYLPRP